MAEQQAPPENVTPEQFFEQLLPAGFEAQKQGGAVVPQDFSMQYHITGPGGGDWHVEIKDGKMTTKKGSADAVLTFTLSIEDFLDAVLSRNGAAPAGLAPANRPRLPGHNGRPQTVNGNHAPRLAAR